MRRDGHKSGRHDDRPLVLKGPGGSYVSSVRPSDLLGDQPSLRSRTALVAVAAAEASLIVLAACCGS